MALEWAFKILDQASGPADKISSSLKRTETGFDKATKAEKGFHVELGNIVKSFMGFRYEADKGVVFNLAEGFSGAAAMAGKLARGVWGVVEELGRWQESKEGFETLLGESEGKAVFAWLDKIQGKTAFTRTQLRGFGLSLAEFYKGDDLQRALVGAMNVGRSSEQRVMQAVQVLKKLKATGKIEGEAYTGLNLKESDVLARVGGAMGEKDIAKVRKAITEGKVDSSVLFESVLAEIAGKSESRVGKKELASSMALPAMIRKLGALPTNLIEDVLGKPEVIKTLQSAIGSIVTAAGKLPAILERWTADPRFIAGIEKASAAFVSFVEQIPEKLPKVMDSIEGIVGAIEGVGRGLKAVGNFFGWWAGVVKDVALGFWELFKPVAWLWGTAADVAERALGRVWQTFKRLGVEFYEGALRIGSDIIDGIIGGITGGIGKVVESVENLGRSVVDKLKGVLGIHSPSAVFAEMGQRTAEGFNLGLDRSAPGIDRAMSRAFPVDEVAAASPYASGSASGAAIGSRSISIGEIVINVSGAAAATPESTGAEVKRQLREFFSEYVDEMAVSVGAR